MFATTLNGPPLPLEQRATRLTDVKKPTFEDAALQNLAVLYRVAKRMTLDPVAAEDLVGLTLLKAASGWEAFDGKYPRSWLIRVMQNAHLKERGKLSAKAIHEPLEETIAAADNVWHDLNVRMLSASILEELDRLPAEYRMAVTLCDMEELSYEEAAEAMEVPVGTVRSRLFRGRKLLRERLAGEMCER